MRSPYLFLLSRSLKNRVISILRRLRRPRYMISAIAGAAYLYFVFFRQALRGGRLSTGVSAPFSDETALLVEILLSVALLIAVIIPWVRPLAHHVPLLTEAEIQFLLPAPVSRRSILRFRIIKGQIGILLGVGISLLLVAGVRRPFRPVPVALTLWLVYSFLGIYRLAVTLVRTRISRNVRAQEWFRRSRILVAAALLGMLLWSPLTYQGQPGFTDTESVFPRLSEVIGQPPTSYVLAPFRMFVRPVFAADWTALGYSTVPVLLVLWMVYGWVVRSDADLGETAGTAVEGNRIGKQAAGRQASGRGPTRRIPFRLRPAGPPWVALFWKNIMASNRIDLRRGILVALLVTVALTAVVMRKHGGILPDAVGAAGAALTGFFALMGPVVFRSDFRSDLLHLDLLKTYPMPGWQVAFGEVLSPAAQLAALEWLSLVTAAICLPAPHGVSWSRADRAFLALGAALLLPLASLIGLLAQNAAALLLPGWVHLGRESQRGVEAIGQRLIAAAVTVLAVLLAGMPAAGLFGIFFLAGFGSIGNAVIPVASTAAAAFLAVESWAGILWLGHLFDRLDPSTDL